MDVASALARARTFVASARNADGAWGYHPGHGSAPEPTVLAGAAGAGAAIAWLAAEDLSYAGLLLPAALAAEPAAAPLREQAIARILATRSSTFRRGGQPEVPLDSEIVAWGWVEGTFAWVEPTAYAVLSLRKAGLGADPRCVDGIAMLRDRQCTDGGWNYGNPVSFGRELTSDVPPSAWASLALGRTPESDRALEVVFAALATPSSVGLACALLAWTARAPVADARVVALVEALLLRQKPDGSFGGRVDWTCIAIVALAAWESGTPHVFAL